MARPEGPRKTSREQKEYLNTHNALAIISSHLIRTAHAVSVRYIIEQPMSSLLYSFRPMLRALAATDAGSCAVPMAAFRGESPKPLILKGDSSILDKMRTLAIARSRHKSGATARLTSSNNKHVTGKLHALESHRDIRKCLELQLHVATLTGTSQKSRLSCAR